MNRKKLSSIILGFLIISNIIPQSIALGAVKDTNKISASSPSLVDTTSPIANFDNITTNKYYDKIVNPEINVTENNINLACSYFEVTQDDGSSNKYYFTDSNVISNKLSQSNSTYTLSNIIKDDGKYHITVYVADLAGNALSSDLTTTFYIESTDVTPVILGITDGEKFHDKVTPTILVSDEFLTKEDVGTGKAISATLNGKPYNLTFDSENGHTLKLIGDTISGNTPIGTQYNLVVSASSKTNPTEVKTKSVDFVIDHNAPTISFSDANNRNIENDKYYTGVIDPVFKIADNYSDTNHNITINGNNYNGSISKDVNGNISFKGDEISADGTYDIVATATDEAGNTTTYETKFTLDNTAPSINMWGIENNEYTNKPSIMPTIYVSDPNIDYSQTKFNLTRNGQNISINPPLDQGLYSFQLEDEGNYSLTVTSVDKAGNSHTSEPENFTIDRTSPILDFNFKDNSYIDKAFKPSVSLQNSSDFLSELLINGISYDSNNIPNFLDNKAYEVTAQGKDKAGNLSAISTSTFTIDTIAPIINVKNLISNFYYNKTIGPNISSADVNAQTFTMTLNGKPYNNESIKAEGSYQLVINSIDKAGNTTNRVIDFVIDKTAPAITIKGLINNTTLTSIISPLISINDANADTTILLDGQDYHGGPITTDGKHTLIIETVDKAGNMSEKVFTFFLKTTPPSIYVSGVENGSSYDSSVTPIISFSKDVVADRTVMTLDGNPYKQGDKISSTGNHELDITVNDNAGNKVTKKIKFTITATNIIAAAVPKVLRKILPSKVTNSRQNLFVVFGSILAIIIGGCGIVLLKLKSINTKKTKKIDIEK